MRRGPGSVLTSSADNSPGGDGGGSSDDVSQERQQPAKTIRQLALDVILDRSLTRSCNRLAVANWGISRFHTKLVDHSD
jgi:hypothetical protein